MLALPPNLVPSDLQPLPKREVTVLQMVYVLNRDTAANLTISSPLEAHKSHTITFAICGMDQGFDNPIFAAIELDYAEADQVHNCPVLRTQTASCHIPAYLPAVPLTCSAWRQRKDLENPPQTWLCVRLSHLCPAELAPGTAAVAGIPSAVRQPCLDCPKLQLTDGANSQRTRP